MITEQQVAEIGNWLSSQTISSEVHQQLRQQYSDIHFTYCMDDDVVVAKPVYEHKSFNLYLVSSSNHCLGFTNDLSQASGLVVAEIEEE